MTGASGVAVAAPADPGADPGAQAQAEPAAPPADQAQPAAFTPDHEGWPNATQHTQDAYPVDSEFTAKWTRADATQIKRISDASAPSGSSSLPQDYTMPAIDNGFPATNEDVWVWDTWTLTDEAANQISYNGWEVIFALVADRHAGYTFDDRHTNARLGYFYRKAGTQTSAEGGASASNGEWTYGGHVFPDGATGAIFEDQDYSHQTEWSGSTRLMEGNKLRTFFTSVAFYRNADNEKAADPHIVQSEGRIYADDNGVWFTGFRDQHDLLVPDGQYYQSKEQNPYVNFRDPFTFRDQNNTADTTDYMVFEGNSAYARDASFQESAAAAGHNSTAATCTKEDLGYQDGDPQAESVESVNAAGAYYQLANVGLARATNKAMTRWEYLPPLLSGNCVNDQTERPQIYFQDGKYYLFTISHRGTYASGMDGPEGVYGFVGNGLRSDYQPMNQSTGIALGNEVNLNYNAGTPAEPDWNQSPYEFQAYSHYVMPGGLVESFIDSIGGNHDNSPTRGGSLAPTVKLSISGENSTVDRSYGTGGLGGFGHIPANTSRTNGGDTRTDRTYWTGKQR